MSEAVINLSALFGGKKWYKSFTAWAVMLLIAGNAGVEYACSEEVKLLAPEVCGTLQKWVTLVSVALGFVGIRRRLPATGTASIALAMLFIPLAIGCGGKLASLGAAELTGQLSLDGPSYLHLEADICDVAGLIAQWPYVGDLLPCPSEPPVSDPQPSGEVSI